MQIELLDLIFEGVIFGLIIRQSLYFFNAYIFPIIKDDAEQSAAELQKENLLIEKKKELIAIKEVSLLKQAEHLSTLEIMVDRWQKKRIERIEKQKKEYLSFFELFTKNLKVKIEKHLEKKRQVIALKKCSLDALKEIQKEQPALLKSYTQKMLSQFLRSGDQ